MELGNATYRGHSAKFLYFETEMTTFVGVSKKLLLFTESAAFPEKSTNFLLLV